MDLGSQETQVSIFEWDTREGDQQEEVIFSQSEDTLLNQALSQVQYQTRTCPATDCNWALVTGEALLTKRHGGRGLSSSPRHGNVSLTQPLTETEVPGGVHSKTRHWRSGRMGVVIGRLVDRHSRPRVSPVLWMFRVGCGTAAISLRAELGAKVAWKQVLRFVLCWLDG